jgi:hypothetical protein
MESQTITSEQTITIIKTTQLTPNTYLNEGGDKGNPISYANLQRD